jgi:hypothetical protein
MNVRIVVAAVAGGAALFLLGFVVYGLALEGWMKTQIVQYPGLMSEAPNFATLILANLVWALLVALIFDRWATIGTFTGGLLGGAAITFFMGLYFNLMTLSFMNLHKSFVPVIVDVIAFTVIGALAGGVVGMVLGIMNKNSSTARA